MSAVYSIFTSPHHPPVADHLPTLIVTPNGRPNQILYTYLHTALNTENYLLTPSDAGDLCVAKLYPPDSSGSLRAASTSANGAASSLGHGSALGAAMGGAHIRCEASRGLNWRIHQTGIQNPVYKLLLPNPDQPQSDQPLFQISKPNPHAPYWSMFYFAYAGHLIPPRRVEFGRISKNPPEAGGGTRVAITGRTDEEKAVWKSIGDGNEDGVEWIVLCAALAVLDDEIVAAAEKAGFPPGGPSGPRLRPPPPIGGGGGAKMPMPPPSPSKARIHPPVNYATEMPRSASSTSLGQADGRLPLHTLPPPSPQRQRVMQQPPHQQQQQQRPMMPPMPRPQEQQRQAYQQPPPPPRSAPPPQALQPQQPPQRQQSMPTPASHSAPNSYVSTPPRQASLAPAPPTGASRQPAGYQPSSRPAPPPNGQVPLPGQQQQQQQQQLAPPRGFQLSDGPSPSSSSASRLPLPGERPAPSGGGDSSAAARMVQREVEAKRMQKLRNGA
ncbi:hypothetical protein BMF94_0975 [Rhodotorula taiwanensis]|uniref:Uncharacterized protein n=1 Tax=Rhodotorula taiwanensis TaxID=741276 RepID=A0A2S5BGK3_9BASI|nr:hypothetical protein BMF94_0975 [Rhodotorula taiwanensis]